MIVNMGALAVAFLTAILFGVCIWLCFSFLTFGMLLLFGNSRRTGKASAVRREILLFLFVVFTTLSIVVFLYAVNRGVYRWFLFFGILLGFFFTRKCFEKTARKIGEWCATEVRRVIGATIHWLFFPFLKIARILARVVGMFLRRLHLRVWRVCDRIKTIRYDKKMRAHLAKDIVRELEHLLSSEEL